MGGGVFGGKGTSRDARTPSSATLEQEAIKEIQAGRPLRQAAQQQGEEILRTGAVPQTQVPLVQRALEQVLSANSQARKQLDEQLAATGMTRTPFGARAVGEQAQQGSLAASLVPMQIAQALLGQGLGVSGMVFGPAMGGLSQAAQTSGQIRSSQIGADAQVFQQMMRAIMQGGAVAGGAPMGPVFF